MRESVVGAKERRREKWEVKWDSEGVTQTKKNYEDQEKKKPKRKETEIGTEVMKEGKGR